MAISSAQWCLLSMLALTFTFFLVEIVVGYLTKSTALVADSFHMLSNVIALVIAYLAILMSPKQWPKSTFGWARAEVLGALVNAVFLVALCFSILIEAIRRFFKPEQLEKPILVLWVGVAGLAINVIGFFLFHDHGHGHSRGGGGGGGCHNDNDDHGDGHEQHYEIPLETKDESKSQNKETTAKANKPRNMNMHEVYLHVLADALGSVIVIISALIVNYTQWQYNVYVDPALSVIMVGIITYSTVPLHIDGILAVHELHVWQLVGDRIIASAHILCSNLENYMKIAGKVKQLLHRKGIHSSTIQPEFVAEQAEHHKSIVSLDSCALDCPTEDTESNNCCEANKCCGSMMMKAKSLSSVQVIDTNRDDCNNNNNQNI